MVEVVEEELEGTAVTATLEEARMEIAVAVLQQVGMDHRTSATMLQTEAEEV